VAAEAVAAVAAVAAEAAAAYYKWIEKEITDVICIH
jgi:hypothetical protein